MSVGNRIPDRFKSFDEPLDVVMFKDFVKQEYPEFSASDIDELLNDIRFGWEEWRDHALEHDPAHGIRSPYKL